MGVRVDRGRLFFDFVWRGVRVREYLGLEDTPANRQMAEEWFAEIRRQLQRGTFDYKLHFPAGAYLRVFYGTASPHSKGTTVKRYLEDWHKRRSPFRADGSLIADADLHPTTWLRYDGMLKQHIIPALGDVPLETLSETHCLTFRRMLLDDKKLSVKTVTNIAGLLHKAMEDAVEERILAHNPVPVFRRRRRRKAELKLQSQPLNLVQMATFLRSLPSGIKFRGKKAHVSGAALFDLYTVWFHTGWRSNEMVALRFDHLDFDRQIVRIVLGRHPRNGGLEALPKEGTREIDCSFDPALFEAFNRRLRASIETGRRDYVFSDSAGRPLSQEWLAKRAWNPTLRLMKIPHRGQYNIRDTFITLALSAGEDPGWVAHVCGNSEEMLFGHYRNWMKGVVRRDGSGISSLLNPEGRGKAVSPASTTGDPHED